MSKAQGKFDFSVHHPFNFHRSKLNWQSRNMQCLEDNSLIVKNV